MFRELSDSERQEFVEWAREQFEPNTEPNQLWHPVVREEWARLQAEYEAQQS